MRTFSAFTSTRLTLLFVIGIAVLARTPTMFGLKRSGWDEHAYVFFAQTLHQDGVAGIQGILAHYGTDDKLNQSPLPLRIMFVALASATCQLLGGFTVDHVAWLSFAAGIGLVAVGFLFAAKLLGNRVALAVAPLLITSPLAASLSRRAMQDSFAALTFLLVLLLYDWGVRRGSWMNYLALGISFTAALLTKETAVVLLPLIACAAVY